ncbi:MAG: ABC transporter permease [Fibrobacterales bacterium]
MLRPGWKKSLNDLLLFKSRSLLVIFAIILGVTGIGIVVTAFSILQTDLSSNYLNTNPASAFITTKDHMDNTFVESLNSMQEIESAELRQKMTGRILTKDNKWLTLILFVVKDFDNAKVSTFTLEDGAYPKKNEIAVERDGFHFFNTLQINDSVEISMPQQPGTKIKLSMSGKLHDPGQPPAHMEYMVYGYISEATYAGIAQAPTMNQLNIIPSIGKYDKQSIMQTTESLATWITSKGNKVEKVFIPEPGQHPHQWQLNSLIFLLGAIGILAFVLSSVLIVNIISFILSKQIRQIGMMKSIGATRFQVMKLYYVSVLALSVISLIVAVPLSISGGALFAKFIAIQLNFNILTESISLWVYLVLGIIGIVFPLITATFPILKGTRISPREALSDYGISANSNTHFFNWISSLTILSPITKLSLKNTFRQKWRTVLTISTLALGFALFMVSLNVRESLSKTLEASSESQKFDISYTFVQPYEIEQLKTALESVDGVKTGLYIKGGKTSFVFNNKMKSNAYKVIAPKLSNNIVDFPIIKGRWLGAEGNNEIVINNNIQTLEPSLVVGESIALMINDAAVPFTIVGVSREFGFPTIYMSEKTYNRVYNNRNTIANLSVVLDPESGRSIEEIDKNIEQVFEDSEIIIVTSIVKEIMLLAIKNHLNILTFMVLAGSILALIVGGLGLVSTININIMERTREIGVMRAIGASTEIIQKMIFIETLFVGTVSLVAAFIVSLPLSIMVANFLGMLIFEIKLDFSISSVGSILAFVLMIVFIKISIFSPNRSINTLYVREALTYE